MRYVRSDVKGLSIARNLGLESTEREVVLYTDDDCRAVDGWVDVDPRALRRRVGGSGDRTDARPHPRRSSRPAANAASGSTRTVSGLDGGHGALMAFRRSTVQELGGFDEVLGAGRELAGAEDLDMFCRVLAAGRAIVHDEDSVVHHVNTREGDAYTTLHHGYGLGLGALANKWVRLQPAVGVPLSAVLVKRTTMRALRQRRDPRRGPAERAMLRGIAAGFLKAARMRLDGERFVDDHRPPAVNPVPVRAHRTAMRGAAPMGDTRPVTVELMRTLDEKFIANTIVFEAARPAAGFIAEGAALRLADGSLDRELIRRIIAGGSRRIPALRQRLMPLAARPHDPRLGADRTPRPRLSRSLPRRGDR